MTHPLSIASPTEYIGDGWELIELSTKSSMFVEVHKRVFLVTKPFEAGIKLNIKVLLKTTERPSPSPSKKYSVIIGSAKVRMIVG